MRLRKKGEAHCLGKSAGADLLLSEKVAKKNFRKYTKRELTELLFENCFGCNKMSAIPQGAFATCKVHQNNNKLSLASKIESKEEGKSYFYPKYSQEGLELTPLQYNSKLMNSIWGLYNRYSVHNFKKIIDANGRVLMAAWGVVFKNNPPTSVLVNKAAVKRSQVLCTENGIKVATMHS